MDKNKHLLASEAGTRQQFVPTCSTRATNAGSERLISEGFPCIRMCEHLMRTGNNLPQRQAEREKRPMITTSLPIGYLSNEVELEASGVVKKFYEMCKAADSGYVALPPEAQAKVVEAQKALDRVANNQESLIEALDAVSEELMASPEFPRVVANLERMVAKTDSAIEYTYSAPGIIVQMLQKTLELVADRNSHIDNYVESFRIAVDETCSAVLADMAESITRG
jgi:hypothetical protein